MKAKKNSFAMALGSPIAVVAGAWITAGAPDPAP
jgi:hypothetical protein